MTGGKVWYRRIWICLLIVWTMALCTPGPWFGQMTVKPGGFGPGKVLHLVIYALLAGAAGWLPLPRLWRLIIAMPLLSAHGAVTEVLQTLVAAREGCVSDWIIDTVGIAVGIAVTWWWWPADSQDLRQSAAPADTFAGRE